MARISSSISGIERSLLNNLAAANAAVLLSRLRESSGHQITSPADNPAGFVMLSSFQNQLSNVRSAMTNVTAASSLVTQTQSGLEQITAQLDVIRTELLRDENHTLTPDERAEAQAKIDAAIEAINDLAGTTYDNRRTLDGSADFIYTGRNFSQVAEVTVYAKPDASETISGKVVSTATKGQLTYTGNVTDQVTADATFTLTGNRGNAVFSVTNGETLSAVATRINNESHKTGVTATVDAGTHTLNFATVDYGSSATIAVTTSSGTFLNDSDAGTNASAVINGETVSSSSNNVDGNRFSVNSNGFRFSIEFTAGYTGTFNSVGVSGDALTFALSPELDRTATLAVPDVQARRLGGNSGTLDQLQTGGSLSGLGNNTAQAIRVVDEAIGELTRVNGNVDGFYAAAVSTASALLTDLQTDLEASIESIDGVNDVEEEDIQLYYEGLAANSVAGLAVLNQQRYAIINMIQHIAGLD